MFKKSAEIKELKLENARLQNDNSFLKSSKVRVEIELIDTRNKLKELSELRSKVREQTKADMIYEALKVIMEGIKPESTKETITLQHQQMNGLSRELQQQGQAQSQNSYSDLLGSRIR